jgi:hypothetical protein
MLDKLVVQKSWNVDFSGTFSEAINLSGAAPSWQTRQIA